MRQARPTATAVDLRPQSRRANPRGRRERPVATHRQTGWEIFHNVALIVEWHRRAGERHKAWPVVRSGSHKSMN